MEDLLKGQDPLLEALEGANPLGIPDLPEVFFEEMRRHFRLDGSGRLLALWRGAGAFLSLTEEQTTWRCCIPNSHRSGK